MSPDPSLLPDKTIFDCLFSVQVALALALSAIAIACIELEHVRCSQYVSLYLLYTDNKDIKLDIF